MKKTGSLKLRLNKLTIRELTPKHLVEVAAGGPQGTEIPTQGATTVYTHRIVHTCA